jgi:hypothetical protein
MQETKCANDKLQNVFKINTPHRLTARIGEVSFSPVMGYTIMMKIEG